MTPQGNKVYREDILITGSMKAGRRKMQINVFDPSIDSDNLGDDIVMDSVWKVVRPLFPGAHFVCIPTHHFASLPELLAARKAALSIVGATNILKSHMLIRSNWKVSPLDYLFRRNVVVLGAGWQQHGAKPDLASRLFFRTVLSQKWAQSVRDHQAYANLSPYVPNTLYTACPTMWELDPGHCATIPVRKAKNALFAVTYYRPAPALDRQIFEMLKRRYERVYFWPQQQRDEVYLRDIGVTDYVRIDATLKAFDDVCDHGDVDFIGARLHSGIRALQRGVRALMLPVDNRAVELGGATGLQLALREALQTVESWIDNPVPTRLSLPWQAIDLWKEQFAVLAHQPAT
jgi:polysaccharide pyruvyl transferase WcaK-like protein